MNKLKVDLENCYGIKKLRTEFDFRGQKVYAIYAPNGAMETSLARTFKNVADNIESKDQRGLRKFGQCGKWEPGFTNATRWW